MNTLPKISLLFSIASSFAFWGCSDSQSAEQDADGSQTKDKSIVVVYENDVHCAVNNYAKLAGLRDAIADTAYVFTVSSGDYLQGGSMCSFSRGSYIVDFVNAVGYDVLSIGNHELDFMPERLIELSKNIDAEITNVNFFKAGSSEPVFKPYVMKTAGTKKIAFVGVLTPEALKSESYAFVDVDGKATYELHENEIYTLVQKAVDDARKDGADYVIVLAHLGEVDPVGSDVSSISLIKNTSGINAVLDGHAHSVMDEMWYLNADGDSVLLTQTGTKLSNVGKLDIDGLGHFHSSLMPVDSSTVESAKVKAVADSLNALTNDIMHQKLAVTDFDLTIEKDGKRAVRNSETNLGDLVADAFRKGTGAQIGVVNGGGVRLSIAKGAVTYGDVLDVSPFFNDVCKIEATGQQILEALEQGTRNYPEEFGGFLQVSGLRYELVTSAEKRVQNVQVESESGEYVDLELDSLYTVGLTDFVARKGAEITAFRESNVLVNAIASDSDLLTDFFKSFEGTVPERYRETQSRITIK